ncbi:MAG: hypothetical protein ER33_03355 [Cyanobium sp. CACIAM 14]|nr:MAG: hypothetical protein ER33_03355 [Cyanobium sp. CACIAM 14]
MKRERGPELEAMRILHRQKAEAPTGCEATGTSAHADATRPEPLLLLVLSHLGVPQEEVEAAWLGFQEPA